jgi:hypothetical protein
MWWWMTPTCQIILTTIDKFLFYFDSDKPCISHRFQVTSYMDFASGIGFLGFGGKWGEDE